MNPFFMNPVYYDGDVDEVFSKSTGLSGLQDDFNALKYLDCVTKTQDFAVLEDGYLKMPVEKRFDEFCGDVVELVLLALKLNEGLTESVAQEMLQRTLGGYKIESSDEKATVLTNGTSVKCTKSLTDLISEYGTGANTCTDDTGKVLKYDMRTLMVPVAAGRYSAFRMEVFKASMRLYFQNYQYIFPSSRTVLHDPQHILRLLDDPNYVMSSEDTLRHFKNFRDVAFPILNSMSVQELSALVKDQSERMLQSSGRYQSLKAAFELAAEMEQEDASKPTPKVELTVNAGDAEGAVG